MTKIVKQKIQLLCVLAFLVSTQVVGQSSSKLYKQGIIAFYEENFKAAEFYFNKVEESGKSHKDSEYRLLISKMVQNKNREESITPLLKYQDKEKTDKFYNYWMGRIYANKYMFAEAAEAYNKFLESNSKKSDEIIDETTSFINHSKKLITYFDNPDNYEVHQLGAPINTEFAELSPVFMMDRDELIFASNRENPSKDRFDIFEAVNTENGWKSSSIIEEVGFFERQSANAQVVNNDGKLFVYKGTAKNGNLYYTERNASGWSGAREFDEKLSSAGIASHFFINDHEDRVIFAKSDSRNGLELMQSFKDPTTGKWEDAHPFAANINTPYDEDSPYLSPDEKTFYFASNRPDGVGGFDIYRSTLDPSKNEWSEPENMGWPINSPDDDIQLKMNPDQKSGYLSSNRLHTKGDFDIYFFWQIQKVKIEGRVVDGKTNEPVTIGEIRFQPSQYVDEYFRAKIGPDGKYETDLIANEKFLVEIHFGTDTLLLDSFELESVEGERITHHKDFFINTTASNSISLADVAAKSDAIVAQQLHKGETPKKTTELVENNKPYTQAGTSPSTKVDGKQETREQREVRESPTNFTRKNVVVKNLYFVFGTSQLKQESEARLQELFDYMKANPSKKIEISGHTDNIGSKQTNLMVSQQRAESVKKWLVSKGIDEKRIITNGYGESRPLASNDDEKNGRELNRRIEVNVMN